MAGKSTIWTRELLSLAIECLRDSKDAHEAMAKLRARTGRDLNYHGMRHALSSAGLGSPSQHLGMGRAKPLPRRPDHDIPIDVDTSEIDLETGPTVDSKDDDPPTLRSSPSPLVGSQPDVVWVDDSSPDVAAIPYNPQSPRGPATSPHYIPAGHELSGVSRLTDGQGETLNEWGKTRVAGAEPAPLPEGFGPPTRIARLQRGDGSVVNEWRTYDAQEQARAEALLEAIRQHVEERIPPLPPVDAPAACDDDMLTIYPLGDPHIGMLAWADEVGENFDIKSATRELTQCMRNLVARAPASKRAIITNLGDFFHATDDKQVTPTAGHKLDVDGRFGKVARVGIDMFVALIGAALHKHQHVTVRNVPGNHDLNACFWISETLRREFKDEPRVVVHDAYRPYQHDQFGKVLLMWAHTDGAKLEQLAAIAAADWPDAWGATRFRYAHGGHIHSRKVVEGPGMIGENHRTLAGRDAWHNWKGYRSGRSLQAITYHREWGEDSRVTEGIERVRASIRGES